MILPGQTILSYLIIIIMGKAKGNEIIKFVLGSKPIHTAQRANCSVLLVN